MRKALDTTLAKLKSSSGPQSLAFISLQNALALLKEVAGKTGVPGLQEGIKGLVILLDAIQKTSQNSNDLESLNRRVQDLNTMLQEASNGRAVSTAMTVRINHLSESWKSVGEKAQHLITRNSLKRVLTRDRDALEIAGLISAVNDSIQYFLVQSTVAIELTLGEHAAETKTSFQEIKKRLDIYAGLNLPRAITAHFTCNDKLVSCLSGTREEILDGLYQWISHGVEHVSQEGMPTPSDHMGVMGTRQIFWINGVAGSGKTTIAYTVAKFCEDKGLLAASFFCSRDNADCSNLKLVFTTIAYQLGQFCPEFKDGLSEVIRSNPDVVYSNASYQLERMIIKPLLAVRTKFPPSVVVIDALDECKDDNSTSAILACISQHVEKLFPLKFLITSRPVPQITGAFQYPSLNNATRPLILHEVRLDVIESDIQCYLKWHFNAIKQKYHISASWPSPTDVEALTNMSSGLFIFAATAARFIDIADPMEQLKILLNTKTVAGSSPLQHLDQLYSQVLNTAFPGISDHLRIKLCLVLGTVAVLQDPLPSDQLEDLLEYEVNVNIYLQQLQAIITVPNDGVGAIRLIHPSFFDFIVDPTRCHNEWFRINPQEQHTILAEKCLIMMKRLKKDICGIRDPTKFNTEVPDLPEMIAKYISYSLQYACKYWGVHVCSGKLSSNVMQLLAYFCKNHLLHWIEVCSLLGYLRNALQMLNSMHACLAMNNDTDAVVSALLYDGERMIQEFFPAISVSALQVYFTALPFTPAGTEIYITHHKQMEGAVKVQGAFQKQWSACMQVMEGHSSTILSVSFSPDGTKMVSGSFDRTVKIWDAITGAHLQTLEGHSGSITSVLFSPDGTMIVSGSDDKTVRVWDAITGAHLQTLEGHSDYVSSVSFSPNGIRLVSGSSDETMRVWDAETATHLQTLEGHYGEITSVSFSPSGMKIVSGSCDSTVRVWNAITGAHLHTIEGHSSPISSVSFSPDGTKIISGSYDNTMKMWDAVTGAHLQTLKGHSDYIRSVSFSPDGTRIVSGSDDKTLRVWNEVTGAHLQTLKGHSHFVRSVLFSPDGTRIISGSNDKTVRVWNAITGAHSQTFEGHSYYITSVSFSPDGTKIVSGSDDKTIIVWDTVTGAHLHILEGHSSGIMSVSFSLDGTMIVSGAVDGTVVVWDAVTGAHMQTLKGHSSGITSVSFSPDGMNIVSGSDDMTVRVRDAVTGDHLHTLDGHSHPISSVSFSPNGTRIASGSNDMTVRVWNAVTGAHLQTLKGHSHFITSVSFSPDGTRIISGSLDETVRVWDAETGMVHIIHNDSNCGQAWPYLINNGWLSNAFAGHKLCWIPVAYHRMCASTVDQVAVVTPQHSIVVLIFTALQTHLLLHQ